MKFLSLLLLTMTAVFAADPFTIKIKTDTVGSQIGSAANQFKLGLVPGSAYNFTIDWGDASSQVITTSASPTHTYASAGTYTVEISPIVPTGFPSIARACP